MVSLYIYIYIHMYIYTYTYIYMNIYYLLTGFSKDRLPFPESSSESLTNLVIGGGKRSRNVASMMTRNSVNMREDRLRFTPLPGYNLIGGEDTASDPENSETENSENSENSEKLI
jgi:hypothetical protein